MSGLKFEFVESDGSVDPSPSGSDASKAVPPPRLTAPTAPSVTIGSEKSAFQPSPKRSAAESGTAEISSDELRAVIEARLVVRERRPSAVLNMEMCANSEAHLFPTVGSRLPHVNTETDVKENELIVHQRPFGFSLMSRTRNIRLGPRSTRVSTEATLVSSIAPDSPCAGLIGLGSQLVGINGYRVAGLSLSSIKFLLKIVESRTCYGRPAALRFRGASFPPAPLVVTDTAPDAKGVRLLPPDVLPLTQGNSSTVPSVSDAQVCDFPLLHLLPLLPHVEVSFTSSPMGILFAREAKARSVRGALPGSEASLALRLGDSLVAVNGKPVQKLTPAKLGALLRKETADMSAEKPTVLKFLRMKSNAMSRAVARTEAAHHEKLAEQLVSAGLDKPSFATVDTTDDSCTCKTCRMRPAKDEWDSSSSVSSRSPAMVHRVTNDAGVIVETYVPLGITSSSRLNREKLTRSDTSAAMGEPAPPAKAVKPPVGSSDSIVEFFENEVVATDAMLGLTFEYGVKLGGRKYDAVLKRVKDSSPFVDSLRCGDRLVAISGKRLADATGKRQSFGAVMRLLSEKLETAETQPVTLTFRTTVPDEAMCPGGPLMSPMYRFEPRHNCMGPKVQAVVVHRQIPAGTLVECTLRGHPLGIIVKHASVEGTHGDSIGSHMVEAGDLIYAVNDTRTEGKSVDAVQRMVQNAHTLLAKGKEQTITFLRPGKGLPETSSTLTLDRFIPSETPLADAAGDGEAAAPAPPDARNRVIVAYAGNSDGIVFKAQDKGVGARVAFCREGAGTYLTPNDRLVAVGDTDVSEMTTADVQHLLLRSTTVSASKPFTALTFKPAAGGRYRARRRSSACI